MSSHTICTIIAKNYLAFARTLCDSFLAQHPGGRCFVLVIDDIDGYFDPSLERFETLSPDVLEIDAWPDFSFKYNITELATAVKPYLLAYLLKEKGIEQILYLDPDILVLGPLENLFKQLDEADMIITPHLDTDYPDDGYMPNDSHIMKSGIYNLGFIGVKKCLNSYNFLLWWQRKLYDHCVIDFKIGYFVDQKFIDYALPLFSGFKIIKDHGYNVAYWNLHSRKIRQVDSVWTCNEEPLYFFHFSDFKAEQPEKISGHQNRYQMALLPELQKLFSEYIKLLQQNGYNETHQWPYTFNIYKNGRKINPKVRYRYRVLRRNKTVNPFEKSNFKIWINYLILPALSHILFGRIYKFIYK